MLFAGMFLVVHGIYEEKLKIAEQNTRIEYKFIPRTYYEEQLGDSELSLKMAPMFNGESPWYDRTIGALADIPRDKK
jgi:hypothetical protein